MKEPYIHPRKHPTTGTVSHEVIWYVSGKRQRKSFDTKQKAEDHARVIKERLHLHGADGFNITDEERVAALRLIKALGKHGKNLNWLLENFDKRIVPFLACPKVSEIAEVVMKKCASKMGAKWGSFKLRFYERLCAHLNNKPLSEVTIDELESICFDPSKNPKTQAAYIIIVSELYQNAIQKGHLHENLAKSLAVPTVNSPAPRFLTVLQAFRLLKYAAQFGLLKYIAIGFFAGLRRAEMLRLDSSAIENEEIEVGEHVAKGRRRRRVPIVDPLPEWLALCPKDGPITDPKTFEERFKALRVAAGIDVWPRNAIRRTAATYALAFRLDDKALALHLGHSQDILHKHYKGLASKSEAAKFFDLRPATVLNQPDCVAELVIEPVRTPAASTVSRVTKLIDHGTNPYRPGSLSARLFTAASVEPLPKPYLPNLAARVGLPISKVKETFFIMKKPAHRSNGGRVRAETVNEAGDIRFVAMSTPLIRLKLDRTAA